MDQLDMVRRFMMKRILLLLVLIGTMLMSIPQASAVCTLTCYVDDDGTGDYNVDHVNHGSSGDEVQIQQAINAVAANASVSSQGVVILNYTSTPYYIYEEIAARNYVSLQGENPSVKMNLLPMSLRGYRRLVYISNTHHTNVTNLTVVGSYLHGNGWCCGKNIEKLIYFTGGSYKLWFENINITESSDDGFRGRADNVTLINVRITNSGHAGILFDEGGDSVNSHDAYVDGVYCNHIGSTCVRFDGMDRGIIKNMYAEDTERHDGYNSNLEFGLQFGSDNSPIKNIYAENITVAFPTYNGIAAFKRHYARELSNLTFKNVLIYCNKIPNTNVCSATINMWGVSGDTISTIDSGSGIIIDGVNGVVIDGATMIGGGSNGASTNTSSAIKVFSSYHQTTVTIKNSNLAYNMAYGIRGYGGTGITWNVSYNNMYGYATSATTGVTLGAGNTYIDPLFNDPNGYLYGYCCGTRQTYTPGLSLSQSFRLKSPYGRWNDLTQNWITTDIVSSSLIDAGDPSSSYSNEPAGNGNRVNMGFDGNTQYASKSSMGNYSISGYVFDNNADALEGAYASTSEFNTPYMTGDTTDVNGYYYILGAENGTYNMTYTKSGFSTAYLNFTLSGANATNKNATITDTTAPIITGLTATKLNRSAIEISYDDVGAGATYQIYRDGVLKTTTTETSWIDNAFSVPNTYQYNVSANDTYLNQGTNTSVNISVYAYTVINATNLGDNSVKSTQSTLNRGTTKWLDFGYNTSLGIYRTKIKFDLSSIPNTSVITSADLIFKIEGSGTGTGYRNQVTNVSLYRGISTQSSSSATWDNTAGESWYDAVGTLNGTQPFDVINIPVGTAVGTTETFDVSALVQGMVNGTWTNNGFVLKASEINSDYMSFHSLEADTTAYRPILTINYSEADANTYTLSGYVNNATSPLSDATVSSGFGNANTNATGYYSISGLSNGTFSFTASKSGYTDNSTSVTISGNTSQNFILTASEGGTDSIVIDNYGIWVDGVLVSNTTNNYYYINELDANSTHTIIVKAHNNTFDYSEGVESTITTLLAILKKRLIIAIS